VLCVNQPKVSALNGYKMEGFSVERLMHFATALEQDVVILSAGGGERCGAGTSREVVELSGCSFTHSSVELFRNGSRDCPIR
jgi:hypothetical protein